ncbi:MAG: hypothetical protein A3F73_13660 [Gallionellales bacterium RIFCSPLOWO2_12_FULL_59_22]|nr:MAG: hypothetical protein A3H99_02850 [Gallionellales bacterium RIFCSPLOWO2_02_FULL_59_110]OGT04635.1 MAG: hypothetical protein A2Z65_02575 [Gallionellales bacterium RIFCSPLOWO2_02_58_13]OGT10364.1 MAG: hypothetical protein A3F73_13660 [Gallionellales bacterium RIFCSPLOWO2_12_FULL_59_22]
MFMAIYNRIRYMLALLAALALLSACGGGSSLTSLAGVGSGGTGIGVVTGFGSLIVDGIHRNDAAAAYSTEAEQGVAAAMPMTGVMLGQSAEFTYDADGNITSVMMSPEVVGTVTAVTASNITVWGTAITVNTDPALGPVTSFVGYASLASVQIGDRVEAHGLLKTDGQGQPYLQATLIVLKPAAAGVRLTGIVSQYSASADSFVIGNETVMLGSATISPAGVALANGQLVTVWSTSAPAGNVITASFVRIKRPAPADGNVTLSGPVSNYVSNASFQIRNVTVDASAASITPSGATLGNDKYVVVAGSYDAATNKLTATSVTVFTTAAPTTVELHGMVANFVSVSSFTLRGVVIDASSASFTGGTAAQLANGVFLVVRGVVANNVVRATTVEFVAFTPGMAPSGSIIEVGGTITAYDAMTGAFTMSMSNGASMSGSMGSGTFFSNGTAANVGVGQAVNITGMFGNNMLTGTVVNFQSGLATEPGTMLMSGIAYNITPTSFMLNGVTIQNNGLTIPSGGLGGGMMGGSRISVSVQLVGGQYIAIAINLMGG